MSHLEKAVSSIKDPLTKELAEYLLKDIPNRCYQELQEGYILRDIQSIRNHYAKSDENEFDIIINPPRISDGFFSVIITAFDLPFLVDSTLSCVARNQIEVFFASHKRITTTETTLPNTSGSTVIYLILQRTKDTPKDTDLNNDLTNVLTCLISSFRDWKSMENEMIAISKNESILAEIKNHKEQSELDLFLKWLTDHNFIFLGSYKAQVNNEVQTPDPKSFKGICKSPVYNIPIHKSDNVTSTDKIINISKWHKPSVIHRIAHMDWLIINHKDTSGNVVETSNFIGFFTSSVYYQSTLSIPLIREKVSNVITRYGEPRHSYNAKELVSAIEAFSRGDLLQMTEDELYYMSVEMAKLTLSPKVRLFGRRDTFQDFANFILFIPRNRFNSNTVKIAEEILCRKFNAQLSKKHTRIHQDNLARIQITLKMMPNTISPTNIKEAEQEIDKATTPWNDGLISILSENFSDIGEVLASKFNNAFDIRYTSTFSPEQALQDVSFIEKALNIGQPCFRCYIGLNSENKSQLELKIYSPHSEPSLSSIMPMLENLGLKVEDMVSYPVSVKNVDSYDSVFIQHFYLDISRSIDSIGKETLINITEALSLIYSKQIDNDLFNNLITSSNLTWREALVFRAYNSYLKQVNFSLTAVYIVNTLIHYHNISSSLAKFFDLRFNPDNQGKGKELYDIELHINDLIESVENSSEEKVISTIYSLIKATKRTNFYQVKEGGTPKDYLSLKISSTELDFLPLPKPYMEIFVYSIRFRAIHLRGGKVARGGIRWSDRSEDMRTEILGLMKAQMTKNAVIVPLGSKGGFVLKQVTPENGIDAYMKEGIECYKIFLSGLLDITDNIIENTTVPPHRVVRMDEDDPYLVVAADKGTATFSDTANAISKEYNFWLGDAFASGGSAGYDHKKLGITARGAWVSVINHFSDLNIDITKEEFSAVGIGDMSGDVFGNGMLLSKKTKLIAAFNHKHIFIDPDPDPEISFNERLRLFNLPRSQWSDYNPQLLSNGGGIFARSSKFISLSPEIMEVLSITNTELSPEELISCILKAPVDLLWNGGIGTYIKSESETNQMVGDKANDGLRVNGSELRCKIVAEGGNLGMTQLGRIEYAKHGGLLNTDFIDNSAGVDCSDHEVNIKILLNDSLKQKKISLEQRNHLLEKMSNEVSELVLLDNKNQALLISLESQLGSSRTHEHGWLINHLSESGALNTKIEALPSRQTLSVMISNKKSLTRPEIAVLIAYAKNSIFSYLTEIDFLNKHQSRNVSKHHTESIKIFVKILSNYFPSELRKDFLIEIQNHKLGNEILSSILANAFVNMLGCTLFHQLNNNGQSALRIINAFLIIKEIFDIDSIWNEALNRDISASGPSKLDLLVDIQRHTSANIEWLLSNHNSLENIEEIAKSYKANIPEITSMLPKHLSIKNKFDILKNSKEILDIIIIKRFSSQNLDTIMDLYYAIGDRMAFSWMKQKLSAITPDDYIDKTALKSLSHEIGNTHINLTLQNITATSASGKNAHCIVPYATEMNDYNKLILSLKSYTGENFFSVLIIALQHAKSFLKDSQSKYFSGLDDVA